MRRKYTFTLSILITLALNAKISDHTTLDQLNFKENKGQIHDQNNKPRPDVLFSGSSGNLTFHLKKDGVSYQLCRADAWRDDVTDPTGKKLNLASKNTIYRIDLNWIGINPNYVVESINKNLDYDIYYKANLNGEGIKAYNYNDVYFNQIYKNINLHYYNKNGALKYDYIVSPGGDYQDIKIEIKGAQQLSINKEGSLIIKTPMGDIEEAAPEVFQNGKLIPSNWKITKNVLSFEIKNYDPNIPLIIDPLTRIWGTHLGGTANENVFNITEDSNSDVYSCGVAASPNNIATTGAFQVTIGGLNDAMLVKYNSSGTKLWGTYIGDAGDEIAYGLSLDGSNNIYMSGFASGTGTAIATTSAHQTTFGGGTTDAFLIKFNPSGSKTWGTYYGGTGNDVSLWCATDSNGDTYIIGRTTSSTGTTIATAAAHQSVLIGTQNGFLAKFNSSGVRQWGTYYGGNTDQCSSVAITTQNEVIISGNTTTTLSSVISTPGSYQPNFAGIIQNAFVAKFNSSGQRQWGTYYGGDGDNTGRTCSVDSNGNIYICGVTSSTSNISTPGCHQPSYGGGTFDAYLAKLNPTGSTLIWGTYYGGTALDSPLGGIDSQGYPFLVGRTLSTASIATPQSYQPVIGGSEDGFIVKFTPSGVRLWGTYFGGTGGDNTIRIESKNPNIIYVGGLTSGSANSVIATPSSFQPASGGAFDGFVQKFYDCTPIDPINQTTSTVSCLGSTLSLSATSGTSTVSWFSSPTSTNAIGTGSTISSSSLGVGTYTYYAEAASSTCSLTSQRTPIVFQVLPNPTVTAVTSETNVLCSGQSATLSANGANNYTWNPGGTGSSIVVSPTITTVYTVTGTYTNGCSSAVSITQSVSSCASINQISKTMIRTKLYPNPCTDGVITVETLPGSTIKLYNGLGQLVVLQKIDDGFIKLDISQLSKGVYLALVENTQTKDTFTKKIVNE